MKLIAVPLWMFFASGLFSSPLSASETAPNFIVVFIGDK